MDRSSVAQTKINSALIGASLKDELKAIKEEIYHSHSESPFIIGTLQIFSIRYEWLRAAKNLSEVEDLCEKRINRLIALIEYNDQRSTSTQSFNAGLRLMGEIHLLRASLERSQNPDIGELNNRFEEIVDFSATNLIYELGKFNEEIVVPFLIGKLTRNASSNIKSKICEILPEFGASAQNAIMLLLNFALNKRAIEHLRASAIEAVGKIDAFDVTSSAKNIKHLVSLFSDSSIIVRTALVTALARQKTASRTICSNLLQLIQEENQEQTVNSYNIIKSAIKALLNWEDSTAKEGILGLLRKCGPLKENYSYISNALLDSISEVPKEKNLSSEILAEILRIAYKMPELRGKAFKILLNSRFDTTIRIDRKLIFPLLEIAFDEKAIIRVVSTLVRPEELIKVASNKSKSIHIRKTALTTFAFNANLSERSKYQETFVKMILSGQPDIMKIARPLLMSSGSIQPSVDSLLFRALTSEKEATFNNACIIINDNGLSKFSNNILAAIFRIAADSNHKASKWALSNIVRFYDFEKLLDTSSDISAKLAMAIVATPPRLEKIVSAILDSSNALTRAIFLRAIISSNSSRRLLSRVSNVEHNEYHCLSAGRVALVDKLVDQAAKFLGINAGYSLPDVKVLSGQISRLKDFSDRTIKG